MPDLKPSAASAMTPYRVTRAVFDYTETSFLRSAWGGQRMFHRISPMAAMQKGGDTPLSSSVFPWSSGAWTLRPKQWDTGIFAESTTGALLLPGSGLTAIDSRTFPLIGSGDGDKFFRKINDGSGYASLSAPAKVTSLSAALHSTSGILPIAKSTSSLPVNQPLCLRFTLDGVLGSAPGWAGAVIFGQYALGFRGNGIAEIWEYGTPTGGSSALWRRHDAFRFSRPNQVSSAAHHILVFPHIGPTGEKYISFASLSLDSPGQASAGLGSTPGGSGATSSTDKLFRWEEFTTDIPDQSGGAANVTTSAQLWILERPTVRGSWQVSKLVFEESGSLTSEFWAGEPGDTRSVELRYVRTLFTGCTVTQEYRDPAGTVTTTPGDSFYVKWGLATTDQTKTPILWGYKLYRSPVFGTSAADSSFAPPATNFDIQPGEGDPRVEQASLLCEDRVNTYPRLHLRAELPLQIVVTDSSSGSPVDVKLFQGYALSPHRTRLGRTRRMPGMSGQYDTGVNPTVEWSQYQVTAAGMWRRLQETTLRTALALEDFAIDTTSATLAPWKVTDAIKRLLTAGGFPASMQRIPDLSLRLWPGIGTQDSDRILVPSTSIAEMVIRLCRNYLGRFLVFDANSGTYGQWTLVGAPSSTTPLANFVGGLDWSPGDPIKSEAQLASYPAGTAPTFGHRESFYIAPENNHLWAFTLADVSNTGGYRVDNHLYNFKSYAVPGSGVTPDLNSPHYLGRERLVILADPTLWAGSQIGGWQATQQAVDYVLYRVFAYTCMAREVVRFQAPLLFVTDPDTGNKRPLRFYDVVTLDGTTGWYVRSCNPNYHSDRQQTADYVLGRLVEYKP